MHAEHCFDYVRQAVMCHADLTPVRNKWFPTVQVFGPDFSTHHTCRDFQRVLDWSAARASTRGPGSEVARDQSLVVTSERHYVEEGHHHGHTA